jgi:hypothetical protein
MALVVRRGGKQFAPVAFEADAHGLLLIAQHVTITTLFVNERALPSKAS